MASPAPSNPLSLELSSLRAYGGEPGALEGVGFWPRAAARIIDLILHYAVSFLAGIFFATVVFIVSAGRVDSAVLARMQHTGIAVFLFVLLGSVAYEIVCEGVHGSTFGKLVLSMAVVQEDGTPCRFGSAVIRSLAYFVDSLFFGVIGYFAMQRTPQMQRYGDEWAHTVVCKRSNLKLESRRSGGRFMLALIFALMADVAVIMVGLLLNLT